MAFIKHNPNPRGVQVGDCVVRAISTALSHDWERTYIELAIQGLMIGDMPSSNHVWGAYLQEQGFKRHIIPNTCPNCYTVKDFCEEHPYGVYILATGTHVVVSIDGDYYDMWDSGDEIPIYYWRKE